MKHTSLIVSIAAVLALFSGHSALAANDTWVGNTSVNWSDTPTNWSATTPVNGDSLFFGTAGSSGTSLNNNITSLSVAGMTFNSGASAYTITGNSFTLAGPLTNSSSVLQTINTNVALGAAVRTITVTSGGGDLYLGGVISSSTGGGLLLSGTGTVTLAGTNTYTTGGTEVGNGVTLIYANAKSIGTGALKIDGGSSLDTISAGITAGSNNPQTWAGDWTFVGSGNLSLGTGAVTLAPSSGNNINLTVDANTLTVGGVISGSGDSLTKLGSGALTLSANNTFTGGVTLSAGTLNINKAGAVGTSGPLGNGGTFTINAGTIDNTSGGAIAVVNVTPIVIGGSFAYSTSAGTSNNSLTLVGAVSMAADQTITLNGAGVLTLSGSLTNISDSVRTLTVNDGSSTTSTSALTLGGYALTGTGSTAARNDVINGSGNVNITGAIVDGVSAGSGLTYSGTGALLLSGANTFTGGVTLNSGTLDINAVGVAGTSGPLGNGGTFTINGGTIDNTSGASKTVANVNPIVIGGNFAYGGTENLLLPGSISLTLSPTITASGTAILTLASSATSTISAGTSGLKTITVNGTGNVNLGSASGTVLSDGSGQLGFTMAGTGTLTFGGTNSFSGDLLVKSGTVAMNGSSAGVASSYGVGTIRLGDTSGTADATLQIKALGSGATLSSNAGLIVQAGSSGTKTLDNVGGNAAMVIGYLVTLDDDLTVKYSGGVGGSTTLGSSISAAAITGTGNLTFLSNGTAPMAISGNNPGFTGGVTVSTGTLELKTNATSALGSANTVAVASGATFDINGNAETIAGLNDVSGAGGTVTNNSATAKTLTLGGSGNYTFGGSLTGTTTNAANLALAVNLTGTGSQSLTNSAGSTYAGGTTISGNSTLLVSNTSGSATGTGALLVNSADAAIGTAGASGTITSTTNTITGGKVLTGGNGGTDTTSILTMTASGSTTFSNATLTFNLSTSGGTELALGSSANVLFGASGTTLSLNLVGGTVAGNTAYTLITGNGTGTSQFTDLNVSGPNNEINSLSWNITGMTGGVSNNTLYDQSYLFLDGSGNIDIEIVPEPGTWALMLGGLALLLVYQRARRSKDDV